MVKEKQLLVGFTKKPFEMIVMTKWPKDYEVYMVKVDIIPPMYEETKEIAMA